MSAHGEVDREPGPSLAGVPAAVRLAKDAFLELLDPPTIEDLAFVGNASDLYPWRPTPTVDLDLCLFVSTLGREVGDRLARLETVLSTQLARQGVDFELRIIRGPYKRTLLRPRRPVIVAHLAVFTEATYREERTLLRYGWRKYRCTTDPGRLARLAPERPTTADLLRGPRGVEERRAALGRAAVQMHEWLLPDLREVDWTVCVDDPLFIECCFAAGATCARNHGRVLGRPEADTLPNVEYFDWYHAQILESAALRELMAMKERARQVGYEGMMPQARSLALRYLDELRGRLGGR